jgi:Putative Ig domain
MIKLSALTMKPLADLTSVLLIASLTACGGGGSGSADDKGRTASANVVITNDSPSVTKQGQFNAEDGYLSRSGKVLVSAGGLASATFSLNVDRRGFYKAFLWNSQASTKVDDIADVAVRHVRGENILIVDQNKRLGQWRLLGVYEFDPAIKNEIQISSRAGGTLKVDAVRFEFFGTAPPSLQFEINTQPGGEETSAEIGELYSENVTVIGGTPPYRFEITGGTLPSGLEFDANNGRIFGTPSLLGSKTIKLEVTDTANTPISAEMEISVVEKAAPVSVGPVVAENKAQPTDGNPVGTAPNLDGLKALLSGIPEGSWIKVNLNTFSSVWTPSERRPLMNLSNVTPSKIILAWSSFAWDPNRGDLWIYGGGHANYSANDVYRWRGATRLWERASLPSEVNQDDRGTWKAVDGQFNAPAAAHTYDNNMFLPIIDRFLVLGGAAFNNGGPYMIQVDINSSRRTGPYLFDPNKADGNKVGGSTGSHVKRVNPYPETVGGNMWQNRDLIANVPSAAPNLAGSNVNGCTGYAVENGKDVAYVAAGGGQLTLYRYVISNVNTPTTDTWTKVGAYVAATLDDQPTCAYDPFMKVFLKKQKYLSGYTYFDYWDLNSATVKGQTRITPLDPSGEFPNLLPTGAVNGINLRTAGMDFDPERRQYALWARDARVWMIKPPPTLTADGSGWTITKQVAPVGATPLDTDSAGGVLGKWKYIPNVDAFMALHGINDGNVWLYKPVGWKFGGTPPSPTEIIIDNAALGVQDPSGGRTFTGTWCNSIAANVYGGGSFYSCGSGIDTYRWTPNLSVAGNYQVYVWWGNNPNRSTSVPISVTHAAGTTTTNYNMRTGGGGWVLHGTYSFNAGKTGYVQVSDANGQAGADAARFVRVSP